LHKIITANKRPITIGAQFRISLELLYKAMSECTPHFVRCLKPNEDCEPMRYVDPFVMRQLQYAPLCPSALVSVSIIIRTS
jgi:myosin heavy subunit